MTNKNGVFRFGGFELDIEQRSLKKGGLEVQLTPKAMALLVALVKGRGRIVEKAELIDTIWGDSFVEDGNLPYTVKLLRKGLGDDDRTQPIFIETIPRRGYRFVASVEEVNDAVDQDTPRPRSYRNSWKQRSAHYVWISLVVIAAVWVVGFGSWYATARRTTAHLWSGPLDVRRLSADGKSLHAVISPDGQAVAYSRGSENEKESVRLRRLGSGNDVELIPASDDLYFGLAFSPDSKSLYFARRPRASSGQAIIYRISLFGGVPEIVVRDAQGWFSISPDGLAISFVRRKNGIEESSSLWVADAMDGKNERLLITRSSPLWIGANTFLQDNTTVAFAAGHSLTGARETKVYKVDLSTGEEHVVTQSGFFTIKGLARLAAGGALLMTGSTDPAEPLRIWTLDLERGEASPFTSDSGNYSGLSVDDAVNSIVSTQVSSDRRVFRSPVDDSKLVELPATANSARFAPDGRIVFSSWMTGNYEIWDMKGDGGSQRQLTTDARSDLDPVSSADGGSIFFSSNRSGEQHVWRMNVDGSDQSQLTRYDGGFPISVSGDGEWVFYKHAKNGTLWRVRSSGGGEEMVLDIKKGHLSVSPDGDYGVTGGEDREFHSLELFSLDTGRHVKSFKLPPPLRLVSAIAWHPGGAAIGYVAADKAFGSKSLLLQPTDGSDPIRVAELGNESIWSLSFSSDGSEFLITRGSWKHDAVLIGPAQH